MKREVDVPLAGARAERGDGEPKGHVWFRGESGDTVKVAVPVELAAAAAMRGAKVRLVVEVEPERETLGGSPRVAGPWRQTQGYAETWTRASTAVVMKAGDGWRCGLMGCPDLGRGIASRELAQGLVDAELHRLGYVLQGEAQG